MAGKVVVICVLLGACSAQLSRFGSRSFSSFQGGLGTRRGLSSQGSGFGSQRTIQLGGSRSFTGTNPQRTSFLSTGNDNNNNVGEFGRRTVSIQRPVATQQQRQLQPTRTRSIQPDSVIFSQQPAPVATQTQAVQRPVAPVQTAPPAQPAPQQPVAPAPAPVQPAAPAVPAFGTAHLSGAASTFPGAMPGGFMGMSPMAAMSPMMNPMMSPMMNPMGMMSPMGMNPMGMGMMGGFPMSYDTMEDLYLDPDRPDPVRVVPPVGGMAPIPAAMPLPLAAQARPAPASAHSAATSGARATSGVDQSVIASALQTALSRIGQRQAATG